MKDLLELTDRGIYCPRADIYIDPWKPVKKALITHGHGDHSRPGHRQYLCTHTAKPVIKFRLGSHIKIQSVDFGETVSINGVKFSFHPAGHIIGSAQIRVEYEGQVWVASGDYKLEDDGLSKPFEPVKCHNFITESTFGLPTFRWKPQQEIFESINQWWRENKENGKVSILTAYALGKAQRILKHLDPSIGKIFTHGAIENVTKIIRKQGFDLPSTTKVNYQHNKNLFAGGLVMVPPSTLNSSWIRKFDPISTAIPSGWMALPETRHQRSVDRGFVLSDHADWPGLNQAIKATGAERVYVTHGYSEIFAKWLNEQGLDARVYQK